MDAKLLIGICNEMRKHNGEIMDGIPVMCSGEIAEHMRDPDNLLGFLKLLGDAVIGDIACYGNCMDCGKCHSITANNTGCIRSTIRTIAERLKKEEQSKKSKETFNCGYNAGYEKCKLDYKSNHWSVFENGKEAGYKEGYEKGKSEFHDDLVKSIHSAYNGGKTDGIAEGRYAGFEQARHHFIQLLKGL